MVLNKESDRVTFNLSPSSLNTFIQSPLLFYLTYVAKVPDDTFVPVCYGLSGGIVHQCLEKYAKGMLNRDETFSFFASQWVKLNLNKHRDIKNKVLDQNEYLLALIRGLNVIDLHNDHVCEEIIKFPFIENEFMKIGIKGIIDLQATKKVDNQFTLIDYKTSNSIDQSKSFERQALFYNFLIHKKMNVLPRDTIFYYLKHGVPKVYSFSHNDVLAFETELNSIANKILEYGTNIANYPIGEINDLFNSKKQACLQEVFRRKNFLNIEEFVDVNY